MQTLPLTRDLVLIGGGHAHALVLRAWGMNPLPGARLTVINPGPSAPYTGMLPGYVAGHYTRTELEIDLVKLARFAGARLVLGRATGLDRARGLVEVEGRAPLAYDVASIDIGIHSEMPALPGFSENGIAAKPLERFAEGWSAHLDRLLAEPTLIDRGAVVIGGGVGGVELAMAMAHGAQAATGRVLPVTVVEAGTALPGVGRRARAALMRHLDRLGVQLIEGREVRRVEPDLVELADGTQVSTGFTTGAAGARPHGWLARTGLTLTDGFVTVDRTLRSSDPSIYAAGDCAHLLHAPRPKAGVYAVRAARVLDRNLRAALGDGKTRAYRPQRSYLKLISLGEKSAVAEKAGFSAEGPRLWRWKDRIDRRFMDRLSDLQPMAAPALPRHRAAGLAEEVAGGKPMCGGCGAKVGRGALAKALAGLPPITRDDIVTGAGDDSAILRIGDTRLALTTDQLRGFTEDWGLMARIAAVHAMGDVWAMGGAPQAALATLTLPRQTTEMQQRMLAEITAEANAVFEAEGAAIAGGHTALGSELSIGFTVTGLAPRIPITLSGAEPGDALILTRPLGSGTILAAEMALEARGTWVAAALEHMARPQGDAARILASANAMTDVTGFGLAGHLSGMLDASQVGARLQLASIPLMEGALELSRAGTRSTLYPSNREIARAMILPTDDRAELLFDPQTAGGLLAAIPPDEADACLAALREAGHPAARVGTILDGPPLIEVN